jgi:hypothetical protein
MDDDCDGEVDEEPCDSARYDDCREPLDVPKASTSAVSFSAATASTGSSCSEPGARDTVVRIDVDETSDVRITVRGASDEFSAALRAECDDPDAELACAEARQSSDGSGVARFHLRGVEPGTLHLWLFSLSLMEAEVEVDFAPPSEPPRNEDCDTAVRLEADQLVLAELVGSASDLESVCSPFDGELVYEFDLDEPADVRVLATAVERDSEPIVSLRSGSCSDLDAELTCIDDGDAQAFGRALPAGRYTVAVSSNPASDVNLMLQVDEPTPIPAGDDCSQPLDLVPGRATQLDFLDNGDELRLPCLASGRDAVRALHLDVTSDVLLKQRLSLGDEAAIALLSSDCREDAPLTCVAGSLPPIRAVSHNLSAGDYLVVSESKLGNPTSVLVATRPARPPIVVRDADDCEAALDVPRRGGFFTGNTSQANPDFTASCDVASVSSAGAPDQILRLNIDERSRVILDAGGSPLQTIVNLRHGEECPGEEVAGGCALALDRGSYLEQVLDPGTYYVQVDGYAGMSGQWNLEVFVLSEE